MCVCVCEREREYGCVTHTHIHTLSVKRTNTCTHVHTHTHIHTLSVTHTTHVHMCWCDVYMYTIYADMYGVLVRYGSFSVAEVGCEALPRVQHGAARGPRDGALNQQRGEVDRWADPMGTKFHSIIRPPPEGAEEGAWEGLDDRL